MAFRPGCKYTRPMDTKLELQDTWLQCLIDHAAKRTKAYEALIYHGHAAANVPPQGDAVVRCDIETADEILRLAMEHCPEAISAIKRGIREAKAGRTT